MSGLPNRFVLRHDDGYVLDPQLDEHEHATVGNYRKAAEFDFIGGVLRLSDNGRPFGRYAVEDRSLLPKRVLFLNRGDSTLGETELEALGDRSYTLKLGGMSNLSFFGIFAPPANMTTTGAPVIVQGGQLYADLAQQGMYSVDM